MRRLERTRRRRADRLGVRQGSPAVLAVLAVMLAAGCSGGGATDGAYELATDTPPTAARVAVEPGEDADAGSLRVFVADDGAVGVDPSSARPGASAALGSDGTSSPAAEAGAGTGAGAGEAGDIGARAPAGDGSGNSPSSNGPSSNGSSRSSVFGLSSPASSSGSVTTSAARETTTTTRSTTATTGQTPTTTSQTTTTTARPTTATTPRPPPPSGEVIHVDASAAPGGNGSQAAPYKTLTQGLDAIKAGQTLVVKGGEYRERIKYGAGGKNTSSSRPILVQAAPGERVVVKGLLNLYNIDHWTLRGINVTWDGERNNSSEHMVLLKNGRSWVFEQAEIWGARSYSGLLIVGTPVDFTVRHLHVHDTHRSNGTHQDHLIYCNCGSGGGVIERNLLVGSPNGRGIKIGTPNDSYPSIANVKIRYNTIVDNTGPSNIQLSYKTSNITIENNLLVSPKDGLSNVTGRNLSGSGNNIVRNNIGWDSAGVVENADKLTDGGGNRQIDPRLDGGYVPTNPEARNYGHRAP